MLAAHPVAVDDAERVRLEIRDAWNAGAKWILLGGGPGVVPLRYATTTFYTGGPMPTDLYFQCLQGDWNDDGDGLFGEGYQSSAMPGDSADLTPEVFLGRAPVATYAEAQQFVSKTIGYQRTPAGDYEHMNLECAEVLFPGNWNPGDPISLAGADLVEPLLPLFDLHPLLHVARLYENHLDPSYRPGARLETFAAVRDSMNLGYNQALVIGQGNTHGIRVGNAELGEADFAALTNGARLMNLYTVGTASAAMDSGGIGRAALLAANGGAVTCIGASHFEFPTAVRNYLREFMRLVYQDSASAVGEALARSRVPFIPFTVFDGVNRWTQMTQHLLGDPELRMWTGPLRTLSVLHLPVVVVGNTTLDVLVLANGQPLPRARVAAWRAGQFLGVAQTNGSGQAVVPISTATPGTFRLTVTGYDARPYEADVTITQGPTPALASLVRAEVTDDGVALTGFVADGQGVEVALYRSGGGADWSVVGRGRPDGAGWLHLIDRSAQPGASYRYRLGIADGGAERFSSEIAVTMPAGVELAVGVVGGQPSTGPLTVRLSLPSRSPVRLEAIDPSGRRVFSRELAGLPSGVSTMRVAEADGLAPGVYFLRLTQGGRPVVSRFVRTR